MGSTYSSLGSGVFERKAIEKSRALVDIPDEAWLETLRSLSFRQWSKVRLVSRQINGVAQRNVSILPCAIIYTDTSGRMKNNKIVCTIPATDAIQWFKDRNIALDIPEGIQLGNAIIGINLKKNRCVDITVLGPAPQKQVVFYAKFCPSRNENAWASMACLLKLFYNPNVKESLSWLEKNVQAKTIDFSHVMEHINEEEFSNFYFDSSWKCAKLETIKLENPNQGIDNFDYVTSFLDVLVKKFRSVVSLPSTFPVIVFSGYLSLDYDNSMKAPISGADVTEVGRDDSRGAYVVSKGPNRMRVECSRKNSYSRTHEQCDLFHGFRRYTLREYNIRIKVYAV